jgi:hypothetical protein
MAGYYGYSKSNNAVLAEEEGRFPASIIANKLRQISREFCGITAQDIKNTVDACEWHHTSKFYNKVYYYDLEEILTDEDMKSKIVEEKTKRQQFDRMFRLLLQRQGRKSTVMLHYLNK